MLFEKEKFDASLVVHSFLYRFVSGFNLDRTPLPLDHLRGSGRSLHVRVDRNLSSCGINNLISADRYSLVAHFGRGIVCSELQNSGCL